MRRREPWRHRRPLSQRRAAPHRSQRSGTGCRPLRCPRPRISGGISRGIVSEIASGLGAHSDTPRGTPPPVASAAGCATRANAPAVTVHSPSARTTDRWSSARCTLSRRGLPRPASLECWTRPRGSRRWPTAVPRCPPPPMPTQPATHCNPRTTTGRARRRRRSWRRATGAQWQATDIRLLHATCVETQRISRALPFLASARWETRVRCTECSKSHISH